MVPEFFLLLLQKLPWVILVDGFISCVGLFSNWELGPPPSRGLVNKAITVTFPLLAPPSPSSAVEKAFRR